MAQRPLEGWCISSAARVPCGPHSEGVTGQDRGEGVPVAHGSGRAESSKVPTHSLTHLCVVEDSEFFTFVR